MRERRARIHEAHPLPKSRRCELLGMARSSAYYRPRLSDDDLRLMRLIDEIHLELPFYGSRRIRDELEVYGEGVNRKRLQRLMRLMGVRALYPKPRTSHRGKGHKIYPYKLTGRDDRAAQSGLGLRYLLRPNGQRLYVFGGDSRLVLAPCLILAGVKHAGECVLCGAVGRGAEAIWRPRELQYGPGGPIHI